MATGVYQSIRPMAGARIPPSAEYSVGFGVIRGIIPTLGYGESPKPQISYLNNASNPNTADRCLTCKQLPNAVIDVPARQYPRGFGMQVNQGFARKQDPGLAYTIPLESKIMPQADNQYMLLNSRIPGID